jgi:hypothetical protein
LIGLESHRRLADELVWVDNRLRAWAAWARDHGINLGYPAENIISRVMRQGAGAIQQGRPPVAMPDEIAQVDRAIAELGRRSAQKRRVVIVQYQYGNEPMELRAKRAGLPRTSFSRHLKDAQWILLGLLDVHF